MKSCSQFRVPLLLLAACAFLSLGSARHLTQAPAPSTTESDPYTDRLLNALEGNASASGPILFKTFEAAYYALVAESGAEPQTATNSTQVAFGNGSSLLVAWDAGNGSLVLAFAVSESDNSSLSQPATDLSPLRYLADFFGGSPPGASPAAASLYFNASSGAEDAIDSLTGGNSSVVRRVVCTGQQGGGALAQLCGPWAQITYPNAQVRVISFGAPRVAGSQHDWALQQLVDLPYLWLTASDASAMGTNNAGALVTSNVTRVIPESQYKGEGRPGSIQYYCTLLNNTLKADGTAIPVTLYSNFSYGYLPTWSDSQYLESSAPSGGGISSTISKAIGTAADTISAAVSTIGNLFGDSDSEAPAPNADAVALSPASGTSDSPLNTQGGVSNERLTSSSSCTAILCKLQPASTAACAAYSDGETLGPGSVTVTAANTSTNVAVAWNAETGVATFAWRGSQERQDWVQNLRLGLDSDTSSAYFDDLYQGTEVYTGELEQFRAVTDQAQNNDSSILAQLTLMAGGATPTRVDCIGHSLGAGLATICGPWAAEQWPTADVRVVAFGSPKAGNLQLAESVYVTVGRIYRAVHQADAVPSLPPFSRYVHANLAIFLSNSSVIADDRPPTKIEDLSWDDHGCEDGYEAAVKKATQVMVPSWVQNMAAASA